MPNAELDLLIAQQTRGHSDRLDDETLADLARSGWLRQDVHVRGAYLSTLGLCARLDHPELVMLNVPNAAVPTMAEAFNAMGGYLDQQRCRFAPGELYLQTSAALAAMFTFADLGDEAAESIGFHDLEQPFLVVIPLP